MKIDIAKLQKGVLEQKTAVLELMKGAGGEKQKIQGREIRDSRKLLKRRQRKLKLMLLKNPPPKEAADAEKSVEAVADTAAVPTEDVKSEA